MSTCLRFPRRVGEQLIFSAELVDGCIVELREVEQRVVRAFRRANVTIGVAVLSTSCHVSLK